MQRRQGGDGADDDISTVSLSLSFVLHLLIEFDLSANFDMVLDATDGKIEKSVIRGGWMDCGWTDRQKKAKKKGIRKMGGGSITASISLEKTRKNKQCISK